MPHKILAADDNFDSIFILSAVLKKEGYAVITATNGLDAIRKAEGEHPDLILLDVMMPTANGFEVCRALKENPNTREIPILMLTAKTDLPSQEEGFALGASEYITKPFNPKQVLEKIRQHLPESSGPPSPEGGALPFLAGIAALSGALAAGAASIFGCRSSLPEYSHPHPERLRS